jgi:hypothetical protein
VNHSACQQRVLITEAEAVPSFDSKDLLPFTEGGQMVWNRGKNAYSSPKSRRILHALFFYTP